MENLLFSTSIEELVFVTAFQRQKLKNLNIFNVEDLLYHFPSRYEDFTQFKNISALTVGETVTIRGELTSIQTKRTWGRRRMTITEAFVNDETGSIKLVWFNMLGPLKFVKKGKFIEISGKTSLSKTQELHFSHPNFELISKKRFQTNEFEEDSSSSTGSLVPIYPETKGLTSFWLRKVIKKLLQQTEVTDFLPKTILKKQALLGLDEALWKIHLPENRSCVKKAKKRLSFERIFLFQLKAISIKQAWDKNKASKIKFKKRTIKKFVTSLPFKLTNSQKKAAWQIIQDLEKGFPMNRLLEGDVGSGKTIVAALAALSVASSNFQVVFLAPTEVLAIQHYEELSRLFKACPFSGALLSGAQAKISDQKATKLAVKKEILSGKATFIVGTHALLQGTVSFKKLALVIIDEQHRFGIKQRAHLQQETLGVKDGLPSKIPHLLTMTATPIPRTLSLALFGNLDLTIINEYPAGRKDIITKVIDSRNKSSVFTFIQNEILGGRQVFFIYPLVEESSKVSQVKAATEEFKNLQKVFPSFKLNLLHGKMKSKDKETIMADFRAHAFDILVATSVIEVGIDIPNASVIVIEGAERFGLAQLHQFRGRVGRGSYQSYCFLITSENAPSSTKRLSVMEKTNNGFVIAEEDLAIRGPGQFLGISQSGAPDIAMESLSDVIAIQKAQEQAQELLASDPALKNVPELKKQLDMISSSIHWE